jgi:hypothetical protein
MNKKLSELKAALFTALCVIVGAQIVTSLITPFISIIATALVLVTIGTFVYYRVKSW